MIHDIEIGSVEWKQRNFLIVGLSGSKSDIFFDVKKVTLFKKMDEKSTILVENIPLSYSEANVVMFFSKYGKVVRVFRENSSLFVQFNSNQTAKKAASELRMHKRYIGKGPEVKARVVGENYPDSLVIVYVSKEDVDLFQKYFSGKDYVESFTPLIINDNVALITVVNFNRVIDYQSLIIELQKINPKANNLFYNIVPHIFIGEDNIESIGIDYEERTLFINSLFLDLSDDYIHSIFSKYGKVLFIHREFKYSLPLIFILMDTRENAQKAFHSLNFSKLPNSIHPLFIVPYLNRYMNHCQAGLLILNEIEATFNTKQLFQEFEQYGEIYAINVCPVTKSFVCFILYKQFLDAQVAKSKCKRKNIFVYSVDAILGTRFFATMRQSPNYSFVTFDYPKIEASPKMHQLIDPNSLCSYYYSVYDENRMKRTLVLEFHSEKLLNKVVDDFILKHPNSHYELIGTSTYEAVFQYFNVRPHSEEYTQQALYYVKNASNILSNRDLRIAFEKIARVSAAMHINKSHYAIVLFEESIDEDDPRLLRLFPNPVFLEPIMNYNRGGLSNDSLSQSEINAKLRPAAAILNKVERLDRSQSQELVRRAENKLQNINFDSLYQLSLDSNKFGEFVNNLTK